jgi:FHS family glucose/mannose:H+ symporter-like MFS transporter
VQQPPSPTDPISQVNQFKDVRARAFFRALGPVFFYFLPAGAATVMLGPLLPSLIHRWQMQDAQAGTLFTAQFLGQLCGALVGTRNLRASVLYGAALSAAGCVAITWFSFAAAPIALFCIGLGLGAGLAAGNVIVGTAMPAARTRLISLLNVSWSIGAILCPMLVRLSAAGGVRLFFLLTAACLAAAALFAIAIPHGLQAPKAIGILPAPPAQIAGISRRTAAKSSLSPLLPLVAFAAAMFLYVGVENSLGGWLPSYAIRTNASLRASSISFCFWMAELVGRLLIAALSLRVHEAKLYRVCLALLLFAEVALCTVAHLSPANIVALAILSGLTLAPLYPLIVAFMLAHSENHPRLGALFACASLGGAIMPWVTGIFSTHFHGLRAGLIIPATGACVLLILSPIITAKPTTQAEA